MHALRTAITIAWIIFLVYWLAAAFDVKEGRASGRRFPTGGLTALSVFLLLRVFRGASLAVHSSVLETIGAVVFASGIALAIWARVQLGRNWGMPMTQKAEPELVTTGPYRRVRHPIYSGIILAMIGTAVAVSVYWLVAVALLGAYFIYSATREERYLTEQFPETYPAYKHSTKMLIPFIL